MPCQRQNEPEVAKNVNWAQGLRILQTIEKELVKRNGPPPSTYTDYNPPSATHTTTPYSPHYSPHYSPPYPTPKPSVDRLKQVGNLIRRVYATLV
jgi:hypothetical protein